MIVARESRQQEPASVVLLPPNEGDRVDAWVRALQAGEQNAYVWLYERYADDINRLVGRFLGPDPDHDDVVQQALMRVLSSVHRLRDPQALRAFVVTVTLNTVRTEIRRRKLRRLWFGTSPVREVMSTEDDHQGRALVQRVYAVLEQLGTEERLAFVLRFIDGAELQQVASTLGCSLATAKRRLARAEARFVKLAAGDACLAERLRSGARWAP